MPEREVSAGGTMYLMEDGGWRPIGHVTEDGITLSADGTGHDTWRDMTDVPGDTVSFELRIPWYMVNEWQRIFTGRLRWTVRSLRRLNKGHPRCRLGG